MKAARKLRRLQRPRALLDYVRQFLTPQVCKQARQALRRRRPGKTLQGFQKALGRVPLRPLRAPAAGVRQQIRLRYAERLQVDGFEPMGCDGSRIECPRTTELEARLGQAGKADAAPTDRVTAFVHLATGLLRSWRLGPGTAAEQEHLRRPLGTLSLSRPGP